MNKMKLPLVCLEDKKFFSVLINSVDCVRETIDFWTNKISTFLLLVEITGRGFPQSMICSY
jgi:hypothetical protein